jgi:hypothetical protein
MTDTLLVLEGPGIPLYSARGLTQTLEPIAVGNQIRRTVNGNLINLAPTQFRKYASKITCTDQRTPAIDGLWIGAIVTVDCVSELAYLTEGGSPTRTVVEGSERVEGLHSFYRPQLTMMVVGLNTSTEEYGVQVTWGIDLEET